ncbi:MAG: hypothetical protein V3T17_02625 [Pseudomonadales bacterium]
MTPAQKKRVALEAVTQQKTITCLANENHTSRKFIRQQDCYLLSSEERRDEDTWAINLMDAEEKGLSAYSGPFRSLILV